MIKLNEQELIRRQKIKKLEESGISPFGKSFSYSNTIPSLIKKYEQCSKEELANLDKNVRICGRIMSKRLKGKAGFSHIQSQGERIQIYVRKGNVSEIDFELFLDSDIGDIFGIEGEIFKTNLGELSIRARKLTHLSKSLKPLPEKFHGLKDIELRYRKRYLDLLMNKESRKVFVLRSKIITSIRKFMDSNDFLEVETPILQTIPGGAKARPFTTYHNALDIPLYMRIAPELYLKRLLVGGLDRVYEIGRNFRNEGVDTQHNPEFTMFEAYQAYAGLSDMMNLCEDIIKFVIEDNNINKTLNFNNNSIDLSKKFRRVHMVDFIKEVTNIDFWEKISLEKAKELAKSHDVELEAYNMNIGNIINAFFEKFCEPLIVQPTFVYGHPCAVSPLTNISEDDRFSERFELFISSVEFSNAYSELNNPIIQSEKFKDQLELAKLGDEEIVKDIDYDYVEALEYGMPPAGGIGIGIDRLVMLLSEQRSIRDVLLFPHNRQKNKEV